MQTPERLIKLDEVKKMTSLGRTTILTKAKSGEFPKPIKLGPRKNAWQLSKVQEWISDQLAKAAEPK